jgi:transmembrane sensor
MALDHAVLEAAANWYVELRCGEADESTHEAHRRWLNADPGHRQAWDRLARLQERFERVGPGIARPTLSSARIKRREVMKVLSLLLAASGTAAVSWRVTPLPSLMADQRTATGEHRSVPLDDGSQLQLNTATAVNIHYGPLLRELQLLRGEILVQTAPDPQARPFVVHTPQGSIRALGTRFVVRSEDDQTRVSVLQHAVEVRTATLMTAVRVEAGQQLLFRRNDLGAVKAASLQADAWTHGMLVVNDWRLDEVLNELQRYHTGYLGCGPGVANLRVSGVFHLADIPAVLDNLTSTLPLRIRRFTPYWTRVESA